jgi:predicted dithiol-disulfide oxidoreductase (DUF899 family)
MADMILVRLPAQIKPCRRRFLRDPGGAYGGRPTRRGPDVFEGRRQLIVYRFLHAPDVTTYAEGAGSYPERGCAGCSFVADQLGHRAHLNACDTTFAHASRAPQADIQGLKARMGYPRTPGGGWWSYHDAYDAGR